MERAGVSRRLGIAARLRRRRAGQSYRAARLNCGSEPRAGDRWPASGDKGPQRRRSPVRRAEFWSKADASSPQRWKDTTRYHRDYIWSEVIGRLPAPSLSANPRTRLIYDRPKFRAYEVMLDVWPGVFAYGILLVP